VTDNEIEVGMRVRSKGHATLPDGVEGEVTSRPDDYGRWGVIPDKPVGGKRGVPRDRKTMWMAARFLERATGLASTEQGGDRG
jgi:hypothetical protein